MRLLAGTVIVAACTSSVVVRRDDSETESRAETTPPVTTSDGGSSSTPPVVGGAAEPSAVPSCLDDLKYGSIPTQFVAPCTLDMTAACKPVSAALDWNTIELYFTPDDGPTMELSRLVITAADCGSQADAWYADPMIETLTFCPQTCALVDGASPEQIVICFACGGYR